VSSDPSMHLSGFSSSFDSNGFYGIAEGLNLSPADIFFLDHNREVNLCRVEEGRSEGGGFMGRSLD
jgi:hypothetical protein